MIPLSHPMSNVSENSVGLFFQNITSSWSFLMNFKATTLMKASFTLYGIIEMASYAAYWLTTLPSFILFSTQQLVWSL
jgi:hypothetical protein